jgi:hypothetical protein
MRDFEKVPDELWDLESPEPAFRCPNPRCPGDGSNLIEGPATSPAGYVVGRGKWVCDDCGTMLNAPSWALPPPPIDEAVRPTYS